VTIVMATLAVLTGLAVGLWMGTYARRFFNAMTMSDVTNSAKVLSGVDDGRQFSMTVTGPGSVPGLPALRVSGGTTLFLRRTREGDGYQTYVRGHHENGSVIYYSENGVLYADDKRL
jgi:hypothetical protein